MTTKMAKAVKTVKVPGFLRNLDTSSLARFQETAGIDRFQILSNYTSVHFCDSGRTEVSWEPGVYDATEDEVVLQLHRCRNDKEQRYASRLFYSEEDGTVWGADLLLTFKSVPDSTYNYHGGFYNTPTWAQPVCKTVRLSPWTQEKKYANHESSLQSKCVIESIVKNLNPYAYPWLKQHGYDFCRYLMAPYLETLVKAGYSFAERYLEPSNQCIYLSGNERKRIVTTAQWEKAYIDALNRLCRAGTSPKEIFKMAPVLFKALKDEKDIMIWDEFRRLDKRISNPIAVKRLLNMDLNKDRVKYICEILKKEYHDKPVLSVDALQKYLTRVDVYEAIDMNEALPLIRDYIISCLNIGKKPIFTGDSLKREHDVTVRMNRDYRNEMYSSKIVTVGHKLQKYGYQEDTFFIRPIKDYDDLSDEAMQQGNCLSAVYPALIANEHSYVFVMREKSNPEKSLATVEVYNDASGLSLGQHLLSHNRPITNKSQLGFIKRWMKYVQSVFAAGATT